MLFNCTGCGPGHKFQNFRLSYATSPNPTVSSGAAWTVLTPNTVAADFATMSIMPDGRIEATGDRRNGDIYRVVTNGASGITGFRLEALLGPDGTVGWNAPASNGNIVLTELEVCAGDDCVLGGGGGPSDTTPPEVSATVSGVLGNNGWYTSDVSVAWTVTETDSPVTSSGCDTQSVTADTSGVTFTCSATSDGGTTTESVTVKRDATAPMISGSRTPAANGAGWNNADVAVTFTCNDGVSGVASCVGDTTLSAEGAGQSATGTATDQAGNTAQASVAGINIDKTSPVLTVSANKTVDAASDAGAVVAYPAATASDALSGAGAVSCAPASGTTFAIGTTTVSCSATDAAGNAGSASFTVTVNDVTTPGRMHGDGFIRKNADKYHFGFEVKERGGRERARLTLRVDYGKRAVVDRKGRTKYEKPDDDVFRATDVDFVAFSDDPTIRPGRRRKVQIDTVLFSGSGKWNGQSGYTYEVSAEDAGEPGRHRESVSITVRNGAGQVVAQVSGELDGGNVQSSRISHGHHHGHDRD
jgi:hypothetical protein